ncbi:MAG: hypothetical protein NZZ41_07730, partial [Candidatus Dojkabacteria bacterium]|nr:hypothetical protein [Candidatus Dojkabacteria bacterium]
MSLIVKKVKYGQTIKKIEELENKREELLEKYNQTLRNESIPLEKRLKSADDIMKFLTILSQEILLEKQKL